MLPCPASPRKPARGELAQLTLDFALSVIFVCLASRLLASQPVSPLQRTLRRSPPPTAPRLLTTRLISSDSRPQRLHLMRPSPLQHAEHFRSPLQPRQHVPYPAARDLPSPLQYDFPASSTSRFPISSIRPDAPQKSSAEPPEHPPKPVYPRHDPLHILSQTPPPPPRSYPDVAPAPPVAPGMLADGVLTAKLPSVRQFLDAATIAPPECPPLPTDKRVLALVALSVFYHPLHPAHWAFWNREQKKATALLVQSVLDTTPTPILSPIGWIDVPENLWILKSMQLAYAPALASLPWYATYTPAEPENRMNLRKRKPLAIIPSTANGVSGDETMDEEERPTPPPRKRARPRRSAASRSADAQSKFNNTPNGSADGTVHQGDGHQAPESAEATLLLTPDVLPTVRKSAKRERIESPEILISVNAADESVQPDPPDAEEVPEPRKSVRQRERRTKAVNSRSPASVASTLTPSVRARGLSQVRTPSRESSSVTPESIGGAESGSSTAVSLCEEEATKSKCIKPSEGSEEMEEEVEEDGIEEPAAKRARVARPRAKSGSRARTATKNTVADESKTNATVQARPKARSRAKARRR